MIDIYHLFKLGVAAGKILKVSKRINSIGIIFKHVAKPMVVLGISGIADAACEEATDIIIKKLEETK